MLKYIRIIAALYALLAANAYAQSNPGFGGRGFPYVGAGAGMPTWGGEVYFNTGRPWCDARSQGAIGNASATSAAADTAAVNACLTILEANGVGGTLYLSSGYYCVNAPISTSGPTPIRFVGTAPNLPSGGATVVSSCGADISVFSINSSFATIENIIVNGKGANFDAGVAGTPTFGASHPAVLLGSGSAGVTIINSAINGGSIPLYCNGCTSPRVIRTTIKYGYGTGTGASAEFLLQNSSNPILDTVHVDQDLPSNSFPTVPITITAWAPATVYAANQIVTMTGPDGHTYYVQATVGGTSGATQPTVKNFLFTFTDGTVTWGLDGPQVMYGIQMDSGSSEMWATNLDLGGSYVAGFAMTNTVGGGTDPFFAHIVHANFLGLQASVNPNNGKDLFIGDSEIIGCLLNGCATVAIASTWQGHIKLVGNTFFSDASPSVGINVVGGVDLVVNGNLFYGANPALTVAPGVSHFAFTSNICGSSTVLCARVLTGSSDHYEIAGNEWSQASSGISDLGGGNDKNVQQSNGYVRTGSAAYGSLPAVNGDAFFGNSALDQTGVVNYALIQDGGGQTLLNASTGQPIRFRQANVDNWVIGASGGLLSRGGVDEGVGNLYLGNASGGNAGFLWFAGFTSGQGHFTGAANAMGTPAWLLPTGSGTMAVSASAPLVENSTTGNLTCPTCATTTSGGALSGTSPISLSAGGAISCPTCATTTNGGALSGTAPITVSVAGAIGLNTGYGLTAASSNLVANLTTITNSIAADVNLNNTSNYFDGPSIAQGTSGTWWVAGTVEVIDGSNATIGCKLWDGVASTPISSVVIGVNAGQAQAIPLSGQMTNPGGNLRISCRDFTTTAGQMKFNSSSFAAGRDSTISAVRVGN